MTTSLGADTHSRRLSTNITYSRFAEFGWTELGEKVRKILTTRILQSPLPLFVLITSGVEKVGGDWCRLTLPAGNANHGGNLDGFSGSPCGNQVLVTTDYSSDIRRPQLTRVSATETEVAIDTVTCLTFKSPSIVAVSITIAEEALVTGGVGDRGSSWKPFLWRCGLCVAQFTIIESSSLELVAAHLRLHMELRCCKTCATLLPNSALAVDAPEALQHRCSSLVEVVNREGSAAVDETPVKGRRAKETASAASKKRPHRESCTTWERYCELCDLGFHSAPQYQQHLKNVHSKKLYICPECKTSFNTKGNMTTHFQRVHNQSDSVTCPICSKRFSNHYNLDRHIRLIHVGQKLNENNTGGVEIPKADNKAAQIKRGYLLLYNTEQSNSAHGDGEDNLPSSSHVAADVSLPHKPPKDWDGNALGS